MCTYLCMNVCVYIYTQIVKIKLGYIIIIYYIWAIRRTIKILKDNCSHRLTHEVDNYYIRLGYT